jgi:hypothetical protein
MPEIWRVQCACTRRLPLVPEVSVCVLGFRLSPNVYRLTASLMVINRLEASPVRGWASYPIRRADDSASSARGSAFWRIDERLSLAQLAVMHPAVMIDDFCVSLQRTFAELLLVTVICDHLIPSLTTTDVDIRIRKVLIACTYLLVDL